MAKKKSDTAIETDDPIARVAQAIEKSYGEDIFTSGQSLKDRNRKVISLGPSLDILVGGGIEEGSWFGLTGNSVSCKTSVALSFAAECQKPENGSRPVFYGLVEGRPPIAVFKGTKGLRLDNPYFNVIQSSAQHILSSQNYLEIFLNILKNVPNAVVIIDSISALCEERELTEGIGTETRGGGAKLFSSFCRQAANVVPVQNSIVIGITHLIANTSGMGAQYVERAARHWMYQCDYHLRATQKSPWKVGEKQIGMEVNWTCNKTRQGTIGGSMKSYVRWGTGVDKVYEVLELALASRLIRQSGAWVYFDCLGDPNDPDSILKAQGAEKAYRLLVEHPERLERLQQKLSGFGGEGEAD